jgi:bifunctional DNA-binding transcriptional regulator/antitoxin component of YhaV-PrlF toxin-antitoxin module
MKRKSKINNANATNTLKTTIPKPINELLGVSAGDMLLWTVELKDNQHIVTIKKSE